jgi:hypothetical protein
VTTTAIGLREMPRPRVRPCLELTGANTAGEGDEQRSIVRNYDEQKKDLCSSAKRRPHITLTWTSSQGAQRRQRLHRREHGRLASPLKQQIKLTARGANRDVRSHFFTACGATSCLSLTTRPLWSPEARREGKEANFAPAASACGTRSPPAPQGTKVYRKQPGRRSPCRHHRFDWLDPTPSCVLVVRCCSCF